MGMGIVSDKDFNSELSKVSTPNSTPISQSTPIIGEPIIGEIVDVTRGRPRESNEVPNGLRQIIGETSNIDGRASAVDLASRFGISPSSVSAYANGSTSTSSYDKTPNQPFIDAAKLRVSKRARIKLMDALSHITGDKLENAKPGELSTVARNMATVIKEMEPETPKAGPNVGAGPTFIFYSPQTRKEENFDIVRVNE